MESALNLSISFAWNSPRSPRYHAHSTPVSETQQAWVRSSKGFQVSDLQVARITLAKSSCRWERGWWPITLAKSSCRWERGWCKPQQCTVHTSLNLNPASPCWRVVAEPWRMLGFMASREEEVNLGLVTRPVTRLDCSELLCDKVLLKYKRDRQSFWHRHQKGAERMSGC